MFATPFSAPLHQSLANHVFGRFMPARPVVTNIAAEAVGAVASEPEVVEDDAFPDLAQRVRDVGEW